MKKLLSIASILAVLAGTASAAPYYLPAPQGGALTRHAYNGSGTQVISYDVPRFLHLTNGRLYYVTSDGGEDCVVRMNADGTNRQVLVRSGREEQATMTTLAGLVVVLFIVVEYALEVMEDLE